LSWRRFARAGACFSCQLGPLRSGMLNLPADDELDSKPDVVDGGYGCSSVQDTLVTGVGLVAALLLEVIVTGEFPEVEPELTLELNVGKDELNNGRVVSEESGEVPVGPAVVDELLFG